MKGFDGHRILRKNMGCTRMVLLEKVRIPFVEVLFFCIKKGILLCEIGTSRREV